VYIYINILFSYIFLSAFIFIKNTADANTIIPITTNNIELLFPVCGKLPAVTVFDLLMLF